MFVIKTSAVYPDRESFDTAQIKGSFPVFDAGSISEITSAEINHYRAEVLRYRERSGADEKQIIICAGDEPTRVLIEWAKEQERAVYRAMEDQQALRKSIHSCRKSFFRRLRFLFTGRL